ncbi:hypothetical protein EW093_07865 [Thiospirochaeta perfilievii]|uniref:AbrB/MazE/SpoVT family DNA-binding domain-containing protein n=1 Tax=Thiospirochaeta perfilievii TaxID=252967 RepID=A0A5C1QG88_9SPIO|nr:hypothetical protein EW093_07865 [Thiospirochaeta perfilievii]
MFVLIIPIGNSKGIRISKNILQRLHIEDFVELEVHKDELLIKTVHKTRPFVIISPNEMNHSIKTVILTPITTKTHKYPKCFDFTSVFV